MRRRKRIITLVLLGLFALTSSLFAFMIGGTSFTKLSPRGVPMPLITVGSLVFAVWLSWMAATQSRD